MTARAEPSANDLDFFIGDWEIVSKDIQHDGSYAMSKARSKAYKFLDGAAVMDEWRSLGQDGSVVFRGASFRTWLPREKKWRIVWMMANVNGQTIINAEKVGDEIHMNGAGEDPGGKFLERARYYDINDNGFKFFMERSYDGGENWITPFNEFTATRANE